MAKILGCDEDLLQFLARIGAGRIVAGNVPPFRKEEQLSDELAVSTDCVFESLDCARVVPGLVCGSVSAHTQSCVGKREHCVKRRVETQIVRDVLGACVLHRPGYDPQLVGDLLCARGFTT